MRHFILCLAFLATHSVAFAGSFTSLELSNDQHTLRITRSDGSQLDAPRYAEQVGFQQPRISRDGRYVGWLALYPNCCTSYPIPLRLVVMDSAQHLYSFNGIKLAVFNWCFLPHARAIAFTQTVVHGSGFQHFEMRTIAEEKLLAAYEYPDEEDDNIRARQRAPAWVHCVPELFADDAKRSRQ